ncbi:hypothetical protein Vadar_007340 [Vaccinium darrowii]|uniref:Uncharacterized protein n=1 Tax=Vaccinium darrowii TaxID=229202 RepID=A0ACB7X827_9ERIC|nr:hypothetical protein Vadar_007340 [Vaccinium darrowii]
MEASSPEEASPMEAEQHPMNTTEINMEATSMTNPPTEHSSKPTEQRKPVEKARSFKAALLNAQNHSMECENQRKSEFDEESDDEEADSEPSNTVSRIKVEFSKEHLKRIRQNHKGCLIVKLLGRNMGFKPLMDRISNLWDLEGLFTPVDLGLGFYLIRFESKSDYIKVYTGGPWIIQDHYLTVRKWRPQFKADMAVAIKTAVWMRFKFLPYEYYDEESLWIIAAKLGKPLKVDINTIDGLRGSYARVCVEIDLSQPLEISVAVGKFDYQIEYEHIHHICFSCGRVGHRKESCGLLPAAEKTAIANPTVGESDSSDVKAVMYNGKIVPDKPEMLGYGDWMLVTRRNQNRNRPTGQAQNGAQRDNQMKTQQATKPGNKIHNLESEGGPSSSDPRKGKGPLAQLSKPTARPNVQKPRTSVSIAQKRKGPSTHADYKFDFNPLLKQQTQAQAAKVSFKPTDAIIIDLNPSNIPDFTLPDATTPFPTSEATTSSLPIQTQKVPPDISLLPTLTYHEFARSPNHNNQLPQNEVVFRARDRSQSPSRGHLAAGGDKPEDQTLEKVICTPNFGEATPEKETNIS